MAKGSTEVVNDAVGAQITNTPLETSADHKGLETQMKGSAASATNLQESASEIARREIDQRIANFRPFQFPLVSDIMRQAQQRQVSNYMQYFYLS